MIAGFSKICMNPPKGTRMMGFGKRDCGPGSESIHDNIFVRALYLTHEDEQALIISFDMCFIGREDADRFKGAIGRNLDLMPRQIMLSATHSHAGPASGYWAYGDYLPPERLYLRELESAVLTAATTARAEACPVTLWAGMGQSSVPMNRRRPMPDGAIEMRPNPDGIVCDALPVLLLKDDADMPVACVFSVSAHPSIMGETAISAEYPGVATNRIDVHLMSECSMFLQGCGGDAKTSVAGEGRDTWHSNDWDVVNRVGVMLGDEVIHVIEQELRPYKPSLQAILTETFWPLEPPDRQEYEQLVQNLIVDGPPREQGIYELWASCQLERLDRGQSLRSAASILIQGLQIGEQIRMIAIEGEPVAEHGLNILAFYDGGVTFPLGYANGEGLYLPVSRQLQEGGYEVDSYGEYGYPSRLGPGMEDIVRLTLEAFQARGIH